MAALRCEPHGSTIATPSPSLVIEGAAGVPGQSQQDWAVRAIVVIVLLLQPRRNLVVHLLVVLELGREDLGLVGAAALGVVVVPCSAEGQRSNTQVQARGGGLG